MLLKGDNAMQDSAVFHSRRPGFRLDAMMFCCSPKFFLLLFLVSAVPIAFLIRLETAKPDTDVYQYYSPGWMRECTKWDAANRRFLISFFEGGMGQVAIPEDYSPASSAVLEEVQLLKDADLAGNATLGFTIDTLRNRAVVAITDVLGNRYSAVAAYDLSTWNRIFLTQLSGAEGEKALANDVAVDEEGNAYVTDTIASKIWRVGVNGQLLGIITNPLFTPKDWYNRFVQLNGIVYHPHGYLLAIHTQSGKLYKIEINGKGAGHEVVHLVDVVQGSLKFGDGMAVLSPTRIVVAGYHSKLVESSDEWTTAKVVGSAKGLTHRVVTAAVVKDGRTYLNHFFGLGYPKRKHVLVEAVFK